jgi:hypothetical protein
MINQLNGSKNVFASNLFRRTAIILFTFFAIFTSAASCNFFGEDATNSNLRYGILKNDPNIYQGGYAFVNTVKNFRNNLDGNGLNTQSGIKLIQTSKDNLYYIAQNKGLFTTNNGGKEWERIYVYPIKGNEKKEWDIEVANNDALKISDVAIVNKDNLFVAGTKGEISYLYKTNDGGKSFTEVYNTQANGKKVFIEHVMMDPDPAKPNTVYLTTSGGGIFKTEDSGSTWRSIVINTTSTFGSANDLPIQMGVLRQYNNKIFILFKNAGLYISDNGETFTKPVIKFAQSGTGDVFGTSYTGYVDKVIQSPNSQDIMLISNKQIFISNNIANEFQQIKIPVEPEKINITDIALDPKEGVNKILMSVDNKLFESKDRGLSWSANDKINQTVSFGNVGQIIIDPEDTRIVYLMLIDPSYKRGNSTGLFFGF